MSLSTAARIASAHVWFFPAGDAYTVPTSGTCAREAKPGALDTGWINTGLTKSFKVKPTVQAYERYAPTPGRKRKWEVLHAKRDLDLSWTTDDLSVLVIEQLFGAERLAAGATQFNPLEGGVKDGWLKVQCYDHADALFLTFDVWVNLEITSDIELGGGDGAEPVTVSFEAKVLHSTLNTGGL